MSDHHTRYGEHRVPTTRWPVAPSNGTDFREQARELWCRFGIVVIWPDQAIPWDMRTAAENAATRLYGPKGKR